ncbi:PD-(D/E)XK nuclease family protein [Calditrichota bacterium]
MSKPNLFEFATSELSQDAFICWLLSWANPANKAIDEGLHNCSINLINAFFQKCGMERLESINNVEIKTQSNNIDILCIINNKFIIIIEDKVGTKNHSNQLKRYIEDVKSRFPNLIILPIYFKTGDQSDYGDVYKSGYQVFSRSDFLAILDKGNKLGIENDIYKDYQAHLHLIEKLVQSYKTLPLSEWNKNRNSWKGFYMELQKRLEYCKWQYVPNKSGGFLGFSWPWPFLENVDSEQSLQLEQEKFCFKIHVRDKAKRGFFRQIWYENIIKEAPNQNIKVKKPARFGNGNYVTFAILEEEYRKTNADGIINMNETINQLHKCEMLLKAIEEDV